jgi:hypothetical protein
VNSRFTQVVALCLSAIRALRCRRQLITFGPMGRVRKRSRFSGLTRSHGGELVSSLFPFSQDPVRRDRPGNQRSNPIAPPFASGCLHGPGAKAHTVHEAGRLSSGESESRWPQVCDGFRPASNGPGASMGRFEFPS